MWQPRRKESILEEERGERVNRAAMRSRRGMRGGMDGTGKSIAWNRNRDQRNEEIEFLERLGGIISSMVQEQRK